MSRLGNRDAAELAATSPAIREITRSVIRIRKHIQENSRRYLTSDGIEILHLNRACCLATKVWLHKDDLQVLMDIDDVDEGSSIHKMQRTIARTQKLCMVDHTPPAYAILVMHPTKTYVGLVLAVTADWKEMKSYSPGNSCNHPGECTAFPANVWSGGAQIGILRWAQSLLADVGTTGKWFVPWFDALHGRIESKICSLRAAVERGERLLREAPAIIPTKKEASYARWQVCMA
jgi:hypothetical protein